MSVNSFDDYPMSWTPKLEDSNRPIYTEIARQLEHDIESGVLKPGTKLPPQRELADFLDINLSTVSRAFKLCADRGLLTGCIGSGTYVSYSSLTKLTDTPGNKLIRLDTRYYQIIVLHTILALCVLRREIIINPKNKEVRRYEAICCGCVHR